MRSRKRLDAIAEYADRCLDGGRHASMEHVRELAKPDPGRWRKVGRAVAAAWSSPLRPMLLGGVGFAVLTNWADGWRGISLAFGVMLVAYSAAESWVRQHVVDRHETAPKPKEEK